MNTVPLPMLACAAEPFDSDAHVFEIKWDGIRGLAAVSADAWQLWGRNRSVYTERYPELALLRRLPAGTIVDGEIVVLAQGRADFQAVLRRHQLRQPVQIRYASCQQPVHFVLFDLLQQRGRCLVREPLERRRALLAELVTRLNEPLVGFSEGVVGAGRKLFARAVAAGQEGIMAKALTSRYWPGQRCSAWQKIKAVQTLPCVIVGYTPGPNGLRSLLVATVRQGCLQYVAELTSGFGAAQQAELAGRLERRRRAKPLVACPKKALWVEAELYCQVQFLCWTPRGRLREAVFRGLVDPHP
jgi:DNA ligase D-like protein (predicted ligase)